MCKNLTTAEHRCIAYVCVCVLQMFGTCETNIIHIAWIALSIWFGCVVPTEMPFRQCVCFILVCIKPRLWLYAVVITDSIRLIRSFCTSQFNGKNDKRRPEAVLMPGITKYSPKSRWSYIEITNIFSESPINDSMDILFVHTIRTFFQLRRQQFRYRIQNRQANVLRIGCFNRTLTQIYSHSHFVVWYPHFGCKISSGNGNILNGKMLSSV